MFINCIFTERDEKTIMDMVKLSKSQELFEMVLFLTFYFEIEDGNLPYILFYGYQRMY